MINQSLFCGIWKQLLPNKHPFFAACTKLYALWMENFWSNGCFKWYRDVRSQGQCWRQRGCMKQGLGSQWRQLDVMTHGLWVVGMWGHVLKLKTFQIFGIWWHWPYKENKENNDLLYLCRWCALNKMTNAYMQV